MIIYVQNICWEFNPYEVTEEEISKVPTRTKLKIDIELCESLEDIKLFYTEDVDNLTDNRFEIQHFDYSLLGYNLDVEEWIEPTYYIESWKRSMEELTENDNLRWG